jgi:hypothetical protein
MYSQLVRNREKERLLGRKKERRCLTSSAKSPVFDSDHAFAPSWFAKQVSEMHVHCRLITAGAAQGPATMQTPQSFPG